MRAAVLLVVLASGAALAQDGRSPEAEHWGWAPDSTWAEDALLYTLDAPEAGIGASALGYYQRDVVPRMARPCPAWPSCSMYARIAIAEWGLVPGTLMTLDRLFFRENAAFIGGQTAFTFRIRNRTRVYDPPDATVAPALDDWRQLHPDYRAQFHSPDEPGHDHDASGEPGQRRGVGL